MRQVIRLLLIIIGMICVVLGTLGVFLPLFPATPFFLLAAGCFARSSKKLNDWLLNNHLFGQYVKHWREGKGIPFKTKIFAAALLFLTIGYSVFYVVSVFVGKFMLVLIAVGVGGYIFTRPTFFKYQEVERNEYKSQDPSAFTKIDRRPRIG